MPFRHVAMFRWAEHVDGDHVRRVREAFDELASRTSGLRHHAHGTDVGVSEGTYDYLVVADFDSVADWRAYRDHPSHVLLIEELISGHVVDRATGQLQLPEERDAHVVSATRMQSWLATPDQPAGPAPGEESGEESDEELLARARRAALSEMQALLADADDAG